VEFPGDVVEDGQHVDRHRRQFVEPPFHAVEVQGLVDHVEHAVAGVLHEAEHVALARGEVAFPAQKLGQGEHGRQRRLEVVAGHALHVLAQQFRLLAVGDVDQGVAQDVGEMGDEFRSLFARVAVGVGIEETQDADEVLRTELVAQRRDEARAQQHLALGEKFRTEKPFRFRDGADGPHEGAGPGVLGFELGQQRGQLRRRFEPGLGRREEAELVDVEEQTDGAQTEQVLDAVEDGRQLLVGAHDFHDPDGFAEFLEGGEAAFEAVHHRFELGLQVQALLADAFAVLAAVEEFRAGQGGGVGPHFDGTSQFAQHPFELVAVVVLEGLLQFGQASLDIGKIKIGHGWTRGSLPGLIHMASVDPVDLGVAGGAHGDVRVAGTAAGASGQDQ